MHIVAYVEYLIYCCIYCIFLRIVHTLFVFTCFACLCILHCKLTSEMSLSLSRPYGWRAVRDKTPRRSQEGQRYMQNMLHMHFFAINVLTYAICCFKGYVFRFLQRCEELFPYTNKKGNSIVEALLDTLQLLPSAKHCGHLRMYSTLLKGHKTYPGEQRACFWPFEGRQLQKSNRQDMVMVRPPGIDKGKVVSG